jgi:hypothetical protein
LQPHFLASDAVEKQLDQPGGIGHKGGRIEWVG